MKTQTQMAGIILAVLFLAGCSGSSSTSDERTISGDLSSGSGSTLKNQVSNCLADTVVATDTSGTATSADVADDCSFEITLTVGLSYVISFSLEDEFVATLLFNSGDAFTASALPISTGDGAINLGTITITGTTAVAENEPLSQCDEDDDGTSDLEDQDDDGDGINDDEEEDCDLDGANDDRDDEDDDCEVAEDGTVRVHEVKPRNDPHTDRGNDSVDLDKDVRMRANCEIDQLSVTSDTFSVMSEDGTEIECTFTFSGSGDGDRVTCEHPDFELDTVYTATVSGILCSDSLMVETRSWSWLTEDDADEDDGNVEDDLDDESEDEEDEEGEDDDEDDDEADEDEDDDEDDDEDEEDDDD